MKIRTIFLIFLILVMCTSSIYAADLPSFIINETGTDYANATSETMGYGTNSYNTNYVKGSAVFPLVPGFVPVKVGLSDCQPIIVDDMIIVQGGDKISVVDKYKGLVMTTYSLSNDYPLFKPGSLFAHRLSEEEYIIVGTEGNQIVAFDLKATHVINTLADGTQQRTLQEVSFTPKWSYAVGSDNYKLLTQAVSLLVDTSTSNYYFGFGTSDGQLIAINGENGKVTSAGKLSQSGMLSGSAPVVMPSGNGKFSTLLASGRDYLVSSYVFGGALYKNSSLNDTMNFDWTNVGDLNNPIALAYVSNGGSSAPVAIMQSKEGAIVGYNVKSGNAKPLFVINKYTTPGAGINGFSVKGKYCVVTQSDGFIYVVDLEKAINEGSSDTDKDANGSVIMSKKLDNMASSAISVAVASEQELATGETQETVSREVMILATKKGNLEMYYLDQHNSGTPIRVPNAFKVNDMILPYLTFGGGIASNIAYGGGSLAFIDGYGNLHCYSAERSDNLALSNMTNSSMTLQKGKTYEAAVDVINYTGRELQDVDMQFFMNEQEVHRSKVDVKADGVTVYLKYTVPTDFDSKDLKIRAQVNMIPESRVVDEKEKYEDNIDFVDVKIADDVDLAVTLIEFDEYPAATKVYSFVTVKNLSEVNVENVPVDFKVNVAGQTATLTRNVSLLAGNETVLVFGFMTPDKETTATIYAEINSTNVYPEKNKSNNTKVITAEIYKDGEVVGCAESRTWTEKVKKYKTVDGVKKPYWKKYKYKATIEATATVTPTTLKAGYGFEVTVNSKVSYEQISGDPRTPSNKPTAADTVRVTVPFGKGTYMLEKTGGNGLSATFQVPIDPTSSIGARKIYTPRDLAGTKDNPETYPIKIDVYGAWSKGGDLCIKLNKAITIIGDMYEDDNTY